MRDKSMSHWRLVKFLAELNYILYNYESLKIRRLVKMKVWLHCSVTSVKDKLDSWENTD